MTKEELLNCEDVQWVNYEGKRLDIKTFKNSNPPIVNTGIQE